MNDNLIVTDFDKQPEIDQYRETRIEYTESLGSAYKSLEVETYMTHAELLETIREVLRHD